MSLDWMPRESEEKNHDRYGSEHWGTKAPCTVYEKRPLKDPKGNVIPGLYVAWITLNNPAQYNSYTTEMVKGVIAGMENSSTDRSVVARSLREQVPMHSARAAIPKSIPNITARRPEEYGAYMELFNNMVDSILMCKKPVICRVNGMRVAGGQEIGMACDLAICFGSGHLRTGRSTTWFCSGWRIFRFPSLVLEHGRCHVELRQLRDVERL